MQYDFDKVAFSQYFGGGRNFGVRIQMTFDLHQYRRISCTLYVANLHAKYDVCPSCPS